MRTVLAEVFPPEVVAEIFPVIEPTRLDLANHEMFVIEQLERVSNGEARRHSVHLDPLQAEVMIWALRKWLLSRDPGLVTRLITGLP